MGIQEMKNETVCEKEDLSVKNEEISLNQQSPDAPKQEHPIWRDSGDIIQINEIFYSIEGEGLRVGQPTTFVRLSKCNLRCFFCDTEFDSYMEMTVDEVVSDVSRYNAQWICLTGGEPLGQNILPLCQKLRNAGYRLHIETNGTIDPRPALTELIEHWTVSPKRRYITEGLTRITELKYVVGKGFREEHVAVDRAKHIYLQPESSEPRYTQKALEILTRHPDWKLSCRIHKILDLP
jgi:7-carboxy-7-deazaguanine synthase